MVRECVTSEPQQPFNVPGIFTFVFRLKCPSFCVMIEINGCKVLFGIWVKINIFYNRHVTSMVRV